MPCMPDPVPGFGHMFPVIALKENMPTFAERLYKHTDKSMVGFYFLRKPGLLVRDPELVKCVLQTKFLSFRNNQLQLDWNNDPVMALNPFFTGDAHLWRTARARTTNHLSAKKLKSLFIIINEVCAKTDAYVDRKVQESGGLFECEIKEHFLKFTGEVVANSAFAIEGQSFEDNPDRFSFTNVAKTIFEPTVVNGIKQSLLFYMPDFAKLLKMSFLSNKADDYFRQTIKAIIKQRKQTSNSAPNDFLQFCLESNTVDDIDSIIADIIIFYSDVYETSSSTLAALFYYLSEYKDVQSKLREQILSVLEANKGEITYESLKDLNYLEQVMFEALRLCPPLGSQMKVCTEEVTLTGPDGLTCTLKPGSPVIVPGMALHRDSKYWPDPEVFNPDRFSPDNQANRNKYVYLPFGEGPRMCVGVRLATMMIKQVVCALLAEYSVEPSSKTKLPLEMEPTSFLTHIKGGLWAKFKKLGRDS